MAKINQILIPETRCFDYASTLGLEFEYVLLISLVLFLGVVSVAVQSALQWQLAVIGVAFAAILLSSVLLQNKYSNMKNISDIYEKIEVLVRRWENRLPDTRVKICVSENTNALIFAVACVSSLESGSSSSSSDGQAHSAPETIS